MAEGGKQSAATSKPIGSSHDSSLCAVILLYAGLVVAFDAVPLAAVVALEDEPPFESAVLDDDILQRSPTLRSVC